MRNHLLLGTLIYTKTAVTDMADYGNILILNSYSRASGVKYEWDKKRDAAWGPQRMNDGKLEVMAVRNWMQLSLATAQLATMERIVQTRELTCVVNSAPDEKRAFHVDGDGMYVTGSFTLHVKRIRAVKFLCYDLDETPLAQSI